MKKYPLAAKAMLLGAMTGMLIAPLSACRPRDEVIATPPMKTDAEGNSVTDPDVRWGAAADPTADEKTASSMALHDLDLSYFVGASDILNTYFTFDDPQNFYSNWPSKGLMFPSESDYLMSSDSYIDCIDYLNDLDRSELSDEDLILLEDMLFDFTNRADLYRYYYYMPQLVPMGGMQVTYPLLTSLIQFKSKSDIERYFLILDDYDDFFAAAVETEKKRSEMGVGWSDDNLDRIIEDCRKLLENKDTNFLKTTFESRLGALGLADQETNTYLERNKELLETVVYPAFENMITELEGLKGMCDESRYLAETDEGKAYYEALFRVQSGTDKSVTECARMIQEKIDEIYDEYLPRWTSKGSYFGFGDLDFDGAVEWCKRFTGEHFPEIRDNELSVYEVPKEYSGSMQPATYFSSPIDRVTSHQVWINTGMVDDPMYDMFTLISHELYPGHLYQHQYQSEHLDNYYQVFATSTPYAEGWAQYGEWVMIHYAPFDKEAAENAWMAQMLYSVLISARLSIGVDYQGWTYEDCKYYIEKYGQDSEVMDEYWMHIRADQCYAVEYAMGYLLTSQILDHAISELSGSVTQDEVLKAYLDLGCAPFSVLEKRMEDYISENK